MLNYNYLLGKPGRNHTLNPTLVIPPADLEEASISPIVIPAIRDQPVRDAVLFSPAHQLDGMPAQLLPSNVMVDPTFVQGKVGVYGESGFDRPMLEKLGLNLLNLGGSGVRLSSEMEVPLILGLVGGDAVSLASRGLALFSGAVGTRARSVVFTGRDLVRLATLL